MASIVRRKDGRAEIRESYTTPNGPRSRTLAIFRELTDADLDKAARRAARSFDRDKLLERARALGVPRFGDSASRSARALLAELQQGRPLAPSLVTALQISLRGLSASNAVRWDMLRWFGASDAERGETLREFVRARHATIPRASLAGLAPIGAPPEDLLDTPLGPLPASEPQEKPAPPDEDLARLTRAFARARIAHAWGDALACSYYAAPLRPIMLELHVFRRPDAAAQVLAELARLGVAVDPALRPHDAGRGVWLRWHSFYIALRLFEDAHQEVCRRRAREVPFGEDSLWILSAEDLLIRTVGCATAWSSRMPRSVRGLSREQLERMLKASKNPWIEITRDVLFSRAGELDVGDVRRWLERLIPDPIDMRRSAFEDAVRDILSGSLAQGADA
jgi:hypothetical protein